MKPRENLLRLLKKQQFEYVPVEFMLCDSLIDTFKQNTDTSLDYMEYFKMPWHRVVEMIEKDSDLTRFHKYHSVIDDRTTIDMWGVGHRSTPTSMHMTQMLCPLKEAEDVSELEDYPFPLFEEEPNISTIKKDVEALHAKGLAAVGNMQCTIWESAWYLRGMENLMMDMMSEDPMAEYILDKVTDISLARAVIYAKAGVDILFLGDDIGMQNSIMMSEDLYKTWLKPRLKRIIDAVKNVRPDITVFYHSCGFIKPLIPHLIDAGIDVLNPVQPECMDFKEIYDTFSNKLSFHGTVGTQTTMPLQTPEEVYDVVHKNLDIAKNGGLFVAPTHLLEPDVPWDNILAYAKACKEYKL